MSDKKEVVSWKDRLAAEAQAVAKAERPATSSISLKAGVISYMGNSVKELPVVIVASAYERTYYDKPYDADNQSSPVCFAQATEESLLVPHDSVEDKPAETCATCPYSQWGSATTGSGKGQACKIRRKLALVPYPSEDYADAEMATLNVPPTSGRYYSAYANKLASATRLPPWAAGTKITTEPDAKTQFKVNFDYINEVPEEQLESIHSRIEAAEQVLMTPYDLTEREEAPAPKKSKKY